MAAQATLSHFEPESGLNGTHRITGWFGHRSEPCRIPRNRQWLGRIWPPAAFPTLPFVFDTPEQAGAYAVVQEMRRLDREQARRGWDPLSREAVEVLSPALAADVFGDAGELQ